MVGDRDGVVAAAQHDRMLQDTRGTDVAGERRGVRAALGEGDEAEDEVEEVFTERRGEGGGCEGGILRRARAVPAAATATAAVRGEEALRRHSPALDESEAQLAGLAVRVTVGGRGEGRTAAVAHRVRVCGLVDAVASIRSIACDL